jgi:hypothetical protein
MGACPRGWIRCGAWGVEEGVDRGVEEGVARGVEGVDIPGGRKRWKGWVGRRRCGGEVWTGARACACGATRRSPGGVGRRRKCGRRKCGRQKCGRGVNLRPTRTTAVGGVWHVGRLVKASYNAATTQLPRSFNAATTQLVCSYQPTCGDRIEWNDPFDEDSAGAPAPARCRLLSVTFGWLRLRSVTFDF